MYSLRRYDWTLHLATIVLCAFFLARAITTYMAGVLESSAETVVPPPPPAAAAASSDDGDKGDDADQYKIILDRNIFNSTEVATAPETNPADLNPQQLGELGPAVKTGLSIKVESTLVIGDGTDRRSSTIISGGKSKGSQAYFVADEDSFAPNVKITKVAKDRIEFVNSGRLEYAELEDWITKKSVFVPPDEAHGTGKPTSDKDKGKPADDASAVGGKIAIDQKEVDDALQNLDKLQNDVRIVPNFQDGKMDGMKVLSIKPGTLVSKLGIRRGDVLEKVNGRDLDMKSGLDLFSSMKDSKNFSLDVVRGGKNQTLEYEIK